MRFSNLALLLPLFAVACGGNVDRDAQPGPAPAALSPEAPVLFPATKDGALFVVGVHADTGATNAFGPALPVDGAKYEITSVTVSADGARALAFLSPKVGTPNWTQASSVLLLGDGASWSKIYEAPGFGMNQASPDLSLVVIRRQCSGTAGQILVVRTDGTHLYEDQGCSAPGMTSFVYAFAPDSSYFVVQGADTSLSLQPARGGATVALSTAGIVGRTFATSVLVADTAGPTDARWVDTQGQPVTVQGYASSIGTPSGLRVSGDGLFELTDRAMRRVGTMPAGAAPDELIAAIADRLVLRRASGTNTLDALAADGTVAATYSPAPPTKAAQLTNTSIAAASRTPKNGWFVVAADHYYVAPAGDGAHPPDEHVEELWLVLDRDGTATSRVTSLRHLNGAGFAAFHRTYVPSASGAYVVYVEDHAAHTVDTSTGNGRALASDYALTDASVTHCSDGSCVVFWAHIG